MDVRFVTVKPVVIFAISVTAELKLDTDDDCHFVTAPIFPLKVNNVLLVPEQTDTLPEIVPPTDRGLTVREDPLIAVPVGVTTLMTPVVAVAGNVAVI